jgi:hypothetical protein
MFVMIWQLFDPRKDTKSIPNLTRELQKANPKVAEKLREEAQKLKPLLDKMSLVRHNVYAHRNRQSTPHDIFAQAKITPRNVRTMVAAAQDLVCQLVVAAGMDDAPKGKVAFQDLARKAQKGAIRVLEILNTYRSPSALS